MHFINVFVFILNLFTLNINNDDSLQPMFEVMNLRKLRVYSEVGA
jgi:hypothetical protein